MDKNYFGILCIFSFLVAVATQSPHAGHKNIKQVEPAKIFIGIETFTIKLKGLSGVAEIPTWNITFDTPGKYTGRIMRHLRKAGGHDHSGGHGGHQGHQNSKIVSGYDGLDVVHFEPGVRGSHGYTIGVCEFPALEYSVIQYTAPSELVSDGRKKVIKGALYDCALNDKMAKSKKQQTSSKRHNVHDGHTDHKH